MDYLLKKCFFFDIIVYTNRMSRTLKSYTQNNRLLFSIYDTFLDEISQNPLSRFLKVISMGYFPYDADHHAVYPTQWDSALLIYCSSGSGYYSINSSKREKLSSHEIILFPPNVPISYMSSKENPWSVYWVHFNGPFYHAFHNNIASHLPLRVSDVSGKRIIEIFKQCFSILKTNYEAEEYLHLCQLTASMFTLINCMRKKYSIKTGEGNSAFNRAIEFMHNHINTMITREQILAETGISSSQLTRLFKQETGMPPIDYFLRLKINAASRDMCLSRLPVYEIAGIYGFNDPLYFSRVFRKTTGLSPRQFRDRAFGQPVISLSRQKS